MTWPTGQLLHSHTHDACTVSLSLSLFFLSYSRSLSLSFFLSHTLSHSVFLTLSRSFSLTHTVSHTHTHTHTHRRSVRADNKSARCRRVAGHTTQPQCDWGCPVTCLDHMTRLPMMHSQFSCFSGTKVHVPTRRKAL